MAASLLALTLSANTTYAKEILYTSTTSYTNRNFEAVEATEDRPPGSRCPDVPGTCTITVNIYDDFTGDIEMGEMVIPFTSPTPSPSQATTQDILDDILIIVESNGTIYEDYQL